MADSDTSMMKELRCCPNCKRVVFESYDEYDHCGAYCAAKGPNITCWGCRTALANQLGHMDEGGCLYVSSAEPESKESQAN